MNSYGNRFRISIFGESHGDMVGVVIDGVPAGMHLSQKDFATDISRRKSGDAGTTPRIESDIPHFASGIYGQYTTGAPLTIVFKNENTRSADYSKFRDWPRPGHADFTADFKYQSCNDLRGGGQFSGRMTLCLVAAGVVAKKLLESVKISAQIKEIAGVSITDSAQIEPIVTSAMKEGDSVGGIVECVCTNVPAGLGEPFFDSLESQIAHLAFSIPGIRGIEFGDGFKASAMKGSQHNDCFVNERGHTLTNGAGGINGGISNGNPLVFRIAVKPTSSISKPQTSFNFATGEMETFSVPGRHDTCIALRVPPVVEAIAAIALINNI